MKPTMLLDVDGVLNCCELRWWRRRAVRLNSDRHSLHPSRAVLKFLPWAWGHFRVYWLTAWFDGANDIARHYGLAPRPALGRRRQFDHKSRGRLLLRALRRMPKGKKFKPGELDALCWTLDDFKLDAVKARFASHKGKVVWIDDDAAGRPAWCARRPNFKFVHTDELRGITEPQMREIAAWAGVPPHDTSTGRL